MFLFPSFIYWTSLGIITYTYIGYPLIIFTLSRLFPRKVKLMPEYEPSITIIVAAYNEEQHIKDKIENLLSIDYPKEKIQIIVASDGSIDRTNEIVSSFKNQNVELCSLPHSGKPSTLNQAIKNATGEVVVFADARQKFSSNALRLAAKSLSDSEIGSVIGDLTIESKKGPGLYWAYERMIRIAEGKFSSVVGGSGCFMAIRRNLFKNIPVDSLLDDMFTPMQIVLNGHRVIHHPDIKVYDIEAPLSGEFLRKARTLAGNFQILHHVPGILNPLKNKIFFQFISHKLLRLICPYALILFFLSNFFLLFTFPLGLPWYSFTFFSQVLLYFLAVKSLLSSAESSSSLERVCSTFVVLNAAAVEGLRRYLKNDFNWSTVRHSRH